MTMTSFPRLFAGLTLALMLVAASGPVRAQESDVDYLSLASRLVADGHYERARNALTSVDPEASDYDPVRHRTLQGLVELRTGAPAAAVDHLREAARRHEARQASSGQDGEEGAEARATRERIQLYLGQALFETERYEQSLQALESTGELGAGIPSVYTLRAQALWELDRPEAAFGVLNEGANRFPDDHRFMRRKVFYYVQLGFFREAGELGRTYLSRAEAGPDDYLAIGRALRRSDQRAEALTILERARLAFPRHRDSGLELAHVYLDRGDTGLAADIVSDLAVYHPALLAEAAELQQQAGRYYQALLLNAGIPDQDKKYRRRLSLLIAMESWETAAGMGAALERNGLLEDDSIRYAYAYALFKAGRYDRADTVLTGISGGETFRQATALREAMERCREATWQCL